MKKAEQAPLFLIGQLVEYFRYLLHMFLYYLLVPEVSRKAGQIAQGLEQRAFARRVVIAGSFRKGLPDQLLAIQLGHIGLGLGKLGILGMRQTETSDQGIPGLGSGIGFIQIQTVT